MLVEHFACDGLKLLRPKVFRDDRGFFFESYSQPKYRDAGITCEFVQDNHSSSCRDTLRGLHFSAGQAKLMRVASGKIFDVAVDIRKGSPTFGQWQGVYLDSEEHAQFFIPAGFAHGFCVMTETADVVYKISSVYDPAQEKGFAWNDPEVGVAWPVMVPILSERDKKAPALAAIL
jgi:dTDP-4-dehydrorhamnose 3,5-epimerase